MKKKKKKKRRKSQRRKRRRREKSTKRREEEDEEEEEEKEELSVPSASSNFTWSPAHRHNSLSGKYIHIHIQKITFIYL